MLTKLFRFFCLEKNIALSTHYIFLVFFISVFTIVAGAEETS